MKQYEKKLNKKRLQVMQINSLLNKLYRQKKVTEFIIKSGVPVNAFYRAMDGKEIKSEQINKIISTLKNY